MTLCNLKNCVSRGIGGVYTVQREFPLGSPYSSIAQRRNPSLNPNHTNKGKETHFARISTMSRISTISGGRRPRPTNSFSFLKSLPYMIGDPPSGSKSLEHGAQHIGGGLFLLGMEIAGKSQDGNVFSSGLIA